LDALHSDLEKYHHSDVIHKNDGNHELQTCSDQSIHKKVVPFVSYRGVPGKMFCQVTFQSSTTIYQELDQSQVILVVVALSLSKNPVKWRTCRSGDETPATKSETKNTVAILPQSKTEKDARLSISLMVKTTKSSLQDISSGFEIAAARLPKADPTARQHDTIIFRLPNKSRPITAIKKPKSTPINCCPIGHAASVITDEASFASMSSKLQLGS
jgi:hypothetical protein